MDEQTDDKMSYASPPRVAHLGPANPPLRPMGEVRLRSKQPSF